MGAGKKQTIGHRYYIGLHLVLCRQADALLEIRMAAKEAWKGAIAGGRGTFNRPNLFGGDEREGGISGAFDFLRGESTQPINDYLASVLGSLASAYRGAVSVVMRRPYIGANSARLPPMKFKLLNISGIHRGWYPEKAVINAQAIGSGASVYIAWNIPGSTTPTQLAGMKTWMRSVVASIGTGDTRLFIKRFGLETEGAAGASPYLDSSNMAFVLDWIDSQVVETDPGSSSDWNIAFSDATSFFAAGYDGGAGANFSTGALADGLGSLFTGISTEVRTDSVRNIVIVLGVQDPVGTSIAPSQDILDAIPGVEVFAFKLDDTDVADYALIDNTPVDGVPTINSLDPEPGEFLINGLLVAWADMNPAHIIRCLWTDPMRGGIALEAEMGDSFTVEADRFFAEGLGLSPRFNGSSVEADRLDVERHADCISFRSRVTGKIEIKAIRQDYDPVDLPVLDSSIVLDWAGLERPLGGETPNQLTVVYTKRENGDPASVTRTNIAGVRRAGRVIPAEPVEYPACTVESLATRLCLRDVSVQSRPLLTGQLTLAYFPPDFDIGEPFIINEPKMKIDNVIVRIIEVQEGNGLDNSVVVSVTEDKFAIPSKAASPDAVPLDPILLLAQPSPIRVVQEAPYYLAVIDQTQETVDAALAGEPDLGVLLATGTKATPAHRDITVGIDDGSGYQEAGQAEFVTETQLLANLPAQGDSTVITVPTSPALDGVTANSLALLGEEIVRIDSMTPNGTDVDIAIGRGCLDTVPAEHGAGTSLIFLQRADPREEQFLAGETVAVKLLTNLTSRRLSLFTAPEDTVTFASRAIRPYPPGNLQVNGSLVHDQFVADIVLTWAHRDRTLQTTPIPEDHTAGDIGPEAGTTYRVRAEPLDENGQQIGTITNVNVGAVTTYDWNDATAVPDGTNRIRFTVTAERGGYESWQRTAITTAVLYSPADIFIQALVGSVQLDWSDLNAGAMQEDDILVYRDTAAFTLASLPAVLATLAADTETYTDTTVSTGNTYFYAVVMRRGSLKAARFIDIAY